MSVLVLKHENASYGIGCTNYFKDKFEIVVTYKLNNESLVEEDISNLKLFIQENKVQKVFVAIDFRHLNYTRGGWYLMLKGLGVVCEKIIKPSAIIGNNVKIGENVFIGDGVIIEDNCTIGYNTYIGSSALIKSGSKIGNSSWIDSKVILGSACVIGSNVVLGTGCAVGDSITIQKDCEVSTVTPMNVSLERGTFYTPSFTSVVRIIAKE